MKNPSMCSSSMPLEMSTKENKVKVSVNKQQVTTTYGKKEGTNRKKGKVLCDVLTSASVPTKRPKVLSSVAPTIESSSSAIIDLPKKCKDIDESITSVIDAVDLPLFYAVESSMLGDMTKQTSKDIDQDSPCCSSHILTSRIPSTSANAILLPVSIQKPKKTGNFAGMSGTSSGSSSNVKKASSSGVLRRSKFSNDSLLKSLRRGKKTLSKDNLRLKKKKMLKSDTNLKRKKSRVF